MMNLFFRIFSFRVQRYKIQKKKETPTKIFRTNLRSEAEIVGGIAYFCSGKRPVGADPEATHGAGRRPDGKPRNT